MATLIKGYTAMQRAFKKADKDLPKDLRETLKAVAEPVRRDAADRAVREITNIGPKWSQMRTSVTQRGVYVAPRQRRGRMKRPNLAPLLMDRAMQPALDAHASETEREVGKALDGLFSRWGH